MKQPKTIVVSLLLFFSYAGFLRAEQPAKPQVNTSPIPLAEGEIGAVGAKAAKIAEIAKIPPEYAPIVDDPKLPRVLIIGDSISIAYTLIVRKELGGVANVHRIAANGGATKTALGDYGLCQWIKDGEKWDVIYFNHGVHDASYRFANGVDKDKDGNYASPARGCKPYVSVEDYEKNLHSIVGILRKTGAKLVFGTTTPIPNSLAEKYVENSELPYNEAAKKVMAAEGVAIVDLWAAVKPQQDKLQGPRNVHFRPEGSEVLGKEVAAAIRTSLDGMEIINVPIADGPCKPTWQSLGDHFKCPAWWRQAKIGVWLFWGPMSVGEEGDWYAKWMYMPKHAWGTYTSVYPSHLETFGHPSQSGFKDLLPLWKAEKWEPEKLMALYKRAGARYVLAQGQHHDNFDNWDSKYQPWNSVKIGPHRDVVGEWKKAADKEGMRFGISFHGDYSLWWYQPAFLADLDGPLKGIPYDAAQNYVGEDTWWKKMGLDLKDLYGIDLKEDVVFPENFTGDPNEFRMQKPLSHGIADGNLKKNIDFARWFATKFTRRVIDAIDKYSPDFIFFDGDGSYPFCGHFTGRGLRADVTPRVIAHLYNKSIAQNGGHLEAMAFTKGNEDPRAVAVNSEAQVFPYIKRDQPWHTENSVGDWVHRPGIFYDSGMVIHQMLEAVSRDGNYIINLTMNPAGELDAGGTKTLKEMGDWMDINGEGIYDSSAWDVWGEGEIVMIKRGLLDKEQAKTPYTSRDIRFTVGTDGAVYAYVMAWPEDGKILIRSLGNGAGAIANVKLLGSKEPLQWEQTATGLKIILPSSSTSKFAWGLKVTGVGMLKVANSL